MTINIYSTDSELEMLRESARRFLGGNWPAERAVADSIEPAELRRIWAEMARQGWLALGASSPDGELRMVTTLLEELGRAGCPAPLLDAFIGNVLLAKIAAPHADLVALRDLLHAGKAALACVLGPHDGDADSGKVRASGSGEHVFLSGRAAFVEGTLLATHFLVLTDRPGEIAVVRADANGVRVTATPGLSVPPLAQVEFDGAAATSGRGGPGDAGSIQSLARLGLLARALGAAARGFELVTEYAKVRVQFGKKIGQYQAIQHKLANCLIGLETSRLALLRAAAAHDNGAADWRYAASCAFASAGPTLRQVCLETHHAFGGVSFWEEHEMPRHFRRIHADLVRCGGVHGAREQVAQHLLGEPAAAAPRRLPDLDLGDRANALRAELRDWLARNWDRVYTEAELALPVNERLARKEFSRALACKGWLGMSWPKEAGGQGRSAFEQLVFEEEMAYAEAPIGWHLASVNMMGPAIRDFGSAEQKARMLPEILKGNVCFCLGYSEPDNGSDLAGIKTRATRVGDEWVIRGQKLYTSTASYANYCWLAARTDPDAKPSHAGISVFVVPMDTPGITLQALKGLNDHRSNVVFWDDVRVPESAIVGEVNGGWKVISAALAYERVALAAVASRCRGYFDKLVEHVARAERNGRPLAADPLVRDRIASLAAELEAARLLAVQTARMIDAGATPVHEAAMVKVYSGELMQRLAETAFDLLGTGATLKGGADSALIGGAFEFCIRDAFLYVIGGGTNEIQRNIIALRGLGLPR